MTLPPLIKGSRPAERGGPGIKSFGSSVHEVSGDPLLRCQVTHMTLPLSLPGLEGRNRRPTGTQSGVFHSLQGLTGPLASCAAAEVYTLDLNFPTDKIRDLSA